LALTVGAKTIAIIAIIVQIADLQVCPNLISAPPRRRQALV
jgi:hypothetical protein